MVRFAQSMTGESWAFFTEYFPAPTKVEGSHPAEICLLLGSLQRARSPDVTHDFAFLSGTAMFCIWRVERRSLIGL